MKGNVSKEQSSKEQSSKEQLSKKQLSKEKSSKEKSSKEKSSKEKSLNGKRRRALHVVGCALATMCVCVLLLVLTACIPRAMIQKQSEKSAEYFAEKDPFTYWIGDYINSVQDNFSDTVLLDILYCVDSEHPFSSVIRARFAQGEGENAFDGYLAAVKEGREPEQEYGRYWHGTMVLLRPLMMFMPIAGIRILCGTAIVLMQAAIIVILWRRKRRAFCICYLLGFLFIHPWMLFSCLEYGTAFFVASAVSLVMAAKKRRTPDFTFPYFAVVGVVTCFMDFLTTETLTFTLPMLLLIADNHLENNDFQGRTGIQVRKSVIAVIQNGICWLSGYLGMFALKIALLTVVAGKDIVISSMTQGFYRLGGEVLESNFLASQSVSAIRRFSGAIWHNLASLYPTHSGKMEATGVWLLTLLIVVIGFVVVFLLGGAFDWTTIIPMGMLALLPYLRFLALSNHSYIHFFYTYRAQMVTLVVFFWFVWQYGLLWLVRRK